jgi:hypothetical protein
VQTFDLAPRGRPRHHLRYLLSLLEKLLLPGANLIRMHLYRRARSATVACSATPQPYRRPAIVSLSVDDVVFRANFDSKRVIAVSPFITSKENIVVNLIYAWLGESRTNRTYDEYMEIASRFPKVG